MHLDSGSSPESLELAITGVDVGTGSRSPPAQDFQFAPAAHHDIEARFTLVKALKIPRPKGESPSRALHPNHDRRGLDNVGLVGTAGLFVDVGDFSDGVASFRIGRDATVFSDRTGYVH